MNQIQATETSKSAKIVYYKNISYTVMGFWFSKVSISKCCKITNYETRVHIWNYTIIERIKAAHVKIKCLELWILFTFLNTNLTQISQKFIIFKDTFTSLENTISNSTLG